MIVLALGAGRYSSDRNVPRMVKSDALRTALSDHRGWLEVKGVSWARMQPKRQYLQLVFSVAAALADANCLAVYLSDEERLLEMNDSTRELLAGEIDPDTRFRLGEEIWIRPDDDVNSVRKRQFRASLAQFAEYCRSQTNNQDCLVEARVSAGRAADQLFVLVEDVNFAEGDFQFVGRLTRDSLMVPTLRTGERMRIEEAEVVAWQYKDGDQLYQYSLLEPTDSAGVEAR